MPYKVLIRMNHVKCRGSEFYPQSNVKRMLVPDAFVNWNTEWPDYEPPEYTSSRVVGQVWADPNINDSNFKPLWNAIDGNVDRTSAVGLYSIVQGRPRNPVGRTGLQGRGLLGKWGPNKAADPIVTRWKTHNGQKVYDMFSKKPILQFVAIERQDCGEWATPGGMVDPNEQVSTTLMREFMEEALSVLEKTAQEKEKLKNDIQTLFSSGIIVYKGYVDDPRNTDNAWIETTAVHFHDEENKSVGSLALKAGDDARNVQWQDVDRNVCLYANHYTFIRTSAQNVNAHW